MKKIYKQMLKIMEESTTERSKTGVTYFHHHSIKRGFVGLCSLLYNLDGGVGDNIRRMETDASKYLGTDVKDLKLYWFTVQHTDPNKAKLERIDFLKWAIKNTENEKDNRKIKRVTD